jgi:hypothetical protein
VQREMTNPSFAHDRSTTEPEFDGLDISPAIAAELLLKRRRVRRSLLEWSRYCGYEPAPHHRLLIDRLERVFRGEINHQARQARTRDGARSRRSHPSHGGCHSSLA